MTSLRFLRVMVLTLAGLAAAAQAGEQPLRYLALQCGGMLSYGQILVLEKLAHESGVPVSELFDGFIGTSAGAIIAAALNVPKKPSREPLISIDDLKAKFRDNIFDAFVWSATWDAKTLDRILQEQYADTYMSQSLKHLMITAYNQKTQRVEIFDSRLAQNPRHDLPMWQAARASASMSFPFGATSVRLNTSDEIDGLIDPGQVGFCNPVPYLEGSLAHLQREFPGREIKIYSIGAGFGYDSYASKNFIHLQPDYENADMSLLGSTIYGAIRLFGGKPRYADVNARAADWTNANQAVIEKRTHVLFGSELFGRFFNETVLPILQSKPSGNY